MFVLVKANKATWIQMLYNKAKENLLSNKRTRKAPVKQKKYSNFFAFGVFFHKKHYSVL